MTILHFTLLNINHKAADKLSSLYQIKNQENGVILELRYLKNQLALDGLFFWIFNALSLEPNMYLPFNSPLSDSS